MSGLDRTAIPHNILDRILELERRLDDLEGYSSLATVDPEGGTDDALTTASHLAIGNSTPHHTALTLGAGGLSAHLGLIAQALTLSSIDHDELGGLGDDDHIQYLRRDATRALTGNWDAGAFRITANEIEADTTILLGGTSINTSGTLTNIPYLNKENEFANKQYINGSADEVQFIIDADASQTAHILDIRDSGGTPYMYVDAAYWVTAEGFKNAGTPSNGEALYLTEGYTDTSGARYTLNIITNFMPSGASTMAGSALRFLANYNSAFNDTGILRGVYGQSVTAAVSSGNVSTMYGGIFSVEHNGSGTLSNGYAVQGNALISATGGNATSLYGGRFRVQNLNAAKTLTDAYGVRIQDAVATGAITNNYGLYIDNQNVGGTLNYAIYTNVGAVSLGGNLFLRSIKSGATQAAASAAANELWKTASHASLPDNVLMIGV